MNSVQCKNCGLLGIRDQQTRILAEVEPSLREQWRFRNADSFLDGKLDKCPECAAGVEEFLEEIRIARHGSTSVPVFEYL